MVAKAPPTRELSTKRNALKRRDSLEKKYLEQDLPALQLSVPALDEGDTNKLTRSKTLLVSPSGQCSTRFEDEEEVVDEVVPLQGGLEEAHSLTRVGMGLSACQSSLETPQRTLGDRIKICFRCLQGRHNKKQINAEKDVLLTYHESFLYGTVPLTTQVRAALRGHFWSNKFLTLESIAALLSLSFYVHSTYTLRTEHWITIGQILCSSFFVFDYLIKLYSAPVRLYYMFSPNGIVDFLSMVPLCLILGGWSEYEAVSQNLLILRVLRVMPVVASLMIPRSAVAQEIVLLVAYTFGAGDKGYSWAEKGQKRILD